MKFLRCLMLRNFVVMLIISLVSSVYASEDKAADREAVADEVFTLLKSIDGGKRITELELERLRRQANPQNATAAIEVIPALLQKEESYDMYISNSYAVFIVNHVDLFGYVNPEVFITAANEVKNVENARWHSVCYHLVLQAIRNATEEEKESMLAQVVELLPFERPGDNVSMVGLIASKYSLPQALLILDELITTHSNNESLVKELGFERERYLRSMNEPDTDRKPSLMIHHP